VRSAQKAISEAESGTGKQAIFDLSDFIAVYGLVQELLMYVSISFSLHHI
jgi:hypothetical protein